MSYYINLILDGVGFTQPNTKAAINGGLQIWNLVAAMTGAFLVDCLGRRTLFIISNVGMLFGASLTLMAYSCRRSCGNNRFHVVDYYYRSFQ